MSKRLLIIIGVIVVILFGVGGSGAAYALSRLDQTTTTSSSVAIIPTANPSSTNTGIGTGQASKGRSVLGVIQSLNSQSIVITMLRGNSTVNVTDSASTQYTTLDGQASFSDLKVGEVQIFASSQTTPTPKAEARTEASSCPCLRPSP